MKRDLLQVTVNSQVVVFDLDEEVHKEPKEIFFMNATN